MEPVKYVDARLRLGDLAGNRFDVLLRNVDTSECNTNTIVSALTSWKIKGFLNYFGMQRFGSQNVMTHEIGAALVQNKYRMTISLILGDETALRSDRPVKRQKVDDSKEAIEKDENRQQLLVAFNRGNFTECLRLLKPYMNNEYAILSHLSLENHDTDYRGALQKLPHTALSMYGHAVQSYIFNKVLSERVSKFGRSPVAGDFVLPEGDFTGPSENATQKVTTISGAEKAELTDVVLPLPGFDMKYPDHLADIYASAAEDLGLRLEDFSKCDTLELKGVYRRICIIPKEVDWELISKDTIGRKFSHIPSDVDKLRDVTNGADALWPRKESPEPEKQLSPSENGGVIVRCTLPPSTYFTMALREVTKSSVEEI